jgi:DNA polymerase III subunit gamma/tau
MTSKKSYIPLARKYRPATFAELSGQDATATALSNAILLKREPHAVIFSGVRGVGKTTSARLYAKALNCETSISPEPCNQCESCLAITQGLHEDVMEIDGASNTSVDDVRALKETVSYVPQRSRFKVYIIDEVHMLSQNAFNALLKTLEEPPEHVVFIFATTELHKIPQTIMSRCQLFHLQRLGLNSILERLIFILKAEGIPFEDKAVFTIAREGHGSMRDALTLLDHVIAVGAGHVSIEALSKIVSHVSSTQFLALLDGLVCRESKTIIAILDELENTGVDMADVVEKVAAMARHAFIVRDVGTETIDFKTLGFDDEETRRLAAIALRAGPMDLNRIFRTLSRARTELDGSALDRYIVENYCLEWCLDPGIMFQTTLKAQGAPSSLSGSAGAGSAVAPTTISGSAVAPSILSGLAPRTISNIRQSLQETSPPLAPSAPPPAPQVATTPVEASSQAAPKSSMADAAASTGPTQSQNQIPAGPTFPPSWRDLVETLKKHKALLAKRLEDVHPIVYSPERMELVIPNDSFLSAALLKPDEQKKLKDAFHEHFGFGGILVFKSKNPNAPSATSTEPALPENLATIQQRESVDHQQKITTEAQTNSVTVAAMEFFQVATGATVQNRVQ